MDFLQWFETASGRFLKWLNQKWIWRIFNIIPNHIWQTFKAIRYCTRRIFQGERFKLSSIFFADFSSRTIRNFRRFYLFIFFTQTRLQIEEEISGEKGELGISSYGVSMTTLEEVFLHLGEEEEQQVALFFAVLRNVPSEQTCRFRNKLRANSEPFLQFAVIANRDF